MLARAARCVVLWLGLLAGGLAASGVLAGGLATNGWAQTPATTGTPPALPAYLRQDLYPKWIDDKAQIKWPPRDGCAAAPVSETLAAGTLIDRFGSEGGRFFSPKGESFAARAVPYVCSKMVYTVYRITRPMHVVACKAAPWFDEPGGATQFLTDQPAFTLRETKSIEVVQGDGNGDAGAAAPCKGS